MPPRRLAGPASHHSQRSEGRIPPHSRHRRLPANRCRLLRLLEGRPADGRLRAGARARRLLPIPLLTTDQLEIIGIVVNDKGVERAINSGGVNTLGFPYSISPGFLERNQRQTPEEAVDALETIGSLAYKAGLDVVAYISMAFGNPYGDPWSVDEVVAACDLLADSGIACVSLADTVGLATPQLVEELSPLSLPTRRRSSSASISTRVRSRPPPKISAAYRAGCRRFDSALGGLGGCPFAQDVLVGNVPTEIALSTLSALGATLPRLQDLAPVIAANRAIAEKYAGVKQ